jgi:transcriptional/translational regulatory protein YebC/TACO1
VIRVTNESLAGKKIDDFELELIDAGADDIIKEEEGVTIYTKPADLDKVKTFLDQKNITAEEAQVESVAKEEQNLSTDDSDKVQAFIDALDEHEDVDEYYTNVNL